MLQNLIRKSSHVSKITKKIRMPKINHRNKRSQSKSSISEASKNDVSALKAHKVNTDHTQTSDQDN